VDSIPSSRPRQALLAPLSVIIGVAVSLALLEGILRFLPVRNGPRTLPVNAANPVIRYTPNRAYTFSVGWRFTIVNRGRTNNYGFVNDRDYDSASHAPLLAVVGDSYVEAFMVPFPETLQGRLASCLGERGRVYSFGASGAALSDYLVEADFARTRFRPQGLVVVVIANDYRESLMRDKPRPRFTYFERDPADSNKLRLRRIDYAPGLLRRLTRPSALIRYFLYNADVPSALARLWARLGHPTRMAVQVEAGTGAADPMLLSDSRRAVEEFLAELPVRSGLDRAHIALVVDGRRPDLYGDPEKITAGNYVGLMRQYFIDSARRRGFQVIDMEPRFIARHQRDGSRFEFPSDPHWNATGHEEAARAVASSAVFARVFGHVACQCGATGWLGVPIRSGWR